VAGLVGIFADTAQGNHSHFMGRPLSVGEAYPTAPPPLSSLRGVLGKKPGFDDLDLYVRSFARVVFEPEAHKRYPWILKWSRPITVGMKGNYEIYHEVLLKQVVDDLKRITGLPMEAEIGVSFDIEIKVTDSYHRYTDKLFCFIRGPEADQDGTIQNSVVLVSPRESKDGLRECFYEDISQSLGFYGDGALVEESMYRGEVENGQWTSPTWHDVIIMRTLYDRRIRPGKHEKNIMPIVREIIAELLEELNAPAD
jgi:hypothetical protein